MSADEKPWDLNEVLPNPDNVCQSEYLAIYETVEAFRDDPEMVEGILKEFQGWAQDLLQKLQAWRGAASAAPEALPTCDRQCECAGDQATVFVEYEADADLDYALEHEGAVYGWFGRMCAKCREATLAWVQENPPYRWREVPISQVRIEVIGDGPWRNVIPDWSEAYQEGTPWDGTPLKSQKYAEHQRSHSTE